MYHMNKNTSDRPSYNPSAIRCPFCQSTNIKQIGQKLLCKEGNRQYPNRQIEITEMNWKCNVCKKRFKSELTF